MKESRDLNISFNKSGSGSMSTKLTIPISFIKDMGLTQEDRAVEVTYDKIEKTITIKKK
ncbi:MULTISPECIES: hypothetical protein [Paraclostridium]|uniref:hypothetical protein n=1 Tax=Paraclostridium TaxID=1849822 RepID=UPI001784CAE1|nr:MULTISPECIES: hypothetical protein [Paraclostridium]MCU9811208.1 AbrB/MazE/SpoVT family DNA-binding domain-containing protein [Paraclostridium sp. AKS81]